MATKKTFLENVELIRGKITGDNYDALIRLSKLDNDLDDSIKKLTIEFMLEDKYVQELDWLYSTLYGQQHTEEWTLRV